MVFAIVWKPGWKDQIQPHWLMHSFLYPLNPLVSSLLLGIRHLLTVCLPICVLFIFLHDWLCFLAVSLHVFLDSLVHFASVRCIQSC